MTEGRAAAPLVHLPRRSSTRAEADEFARRLGRWLADVATNRDNPRQDTRKDTTQ